MATSSVLLTDAAPLAAALAAVLAPPRLVSDATWGQSVAHAARDLVHADAARLTVRTERAAHEFTSGDPAGLPRASGALVRLSARDVGRAGVVRLTLGCRLPDRDAAPRKLRHAHALLDLLRPALAAAARERFAAHAIGADVQRTLDALEHPAALYAGDGRLLHANTALRQRTAEGAHGAQLARDVERVAGSVGSRDQPDTTSRIAARRLVLTTGLEATLVTVHGAEPVADGQVSASLRRRFGLSPRESEVARLLAAGRANAEIARTLGIREPTARHHTQRVLDKLGVRSRAAVASLLLAQAHARLGAASK